MSIVTIYVTTQCHIFILSDVEVEVSSNVHLLLELCSLDDDKCERAPFLCNIELHNIIPMSVLCTCQISKVDGESSF